MFSLVFLDFGWVVGPLGYENARGEGDSSQIFSRWDVQETSFSYRMSGTLSAGNSLINLVRRRLLDLRQPLRQSASQILRIFPGKYSISFRTASLITYINSGQNDYIHKFLFWAVISKIALQTETALGQNFCRILQILLASWCACLYAQVGKFASEEETLVKNSWIFGAAGPKLWKNEEEGKSCEKPGIPGAMGPQM